MSNDANIKKLLQKVEDKRKLLGTKPRPNFLTNMLFRDHFEPNPINLNTLTTKKSCITVLKKLAYQALVNEVVKEWTKETDLNYGEHSIDDWKHDLLLILSRINWDIKKQELAALEAQLKALRSEDAKTEDALADILKTLSA